MFAVRLKTTFRCLLPLLVLSIASWSVASNFVLTILHTNDMHAHVEPTKIRGKSYGGYARLATLIAKYRAADKNVLLLNGGDTFQGSLFFNVYEGLADLAFMNLVGFDAMAIGNHEFDRGPKVLANFAKLTRFPLLAANLDVSGDPDLNGYVAGGATVQVGKEKLAVVGAITPELPTISSIGPNIRMLDLVRSCQANIDAFRKQGINKIVLLTHVGYEEEVELVKNLHGVDVLVGGHSHTLLGDIKVDGFSRSAGPYPTVVKNADGDTALVVQAHDWGKLLGRIKVEFDSKGRVVKWHDAKPILVDESVPEDPVVKSLIAAFQRPIVDLANKELGLAPNGVSRDAGPAGESAMGNMIADAMLEATQPQGAVAAFMNAGGVRGSLEPGKITYGMAISVQPFNNTLVLLDVTGGELQAALEHGASESGMLHLSKGSSYRIDKSKPKGQMVSDVVIAGERLDPTKTYRICLNSFVAAGGDAHEALKNAKGRRADTGMLDIDALIEYLKKHSPVDPKREGRISGPSGVMEVFAPRWFALWAQSLNGTQASMPAPRSASILARKRLNTRFFLTPHAIA